MHKGRTWIGLPSWVTSPVSARVYVKTRANVDAELASPKNSRADVFSVMRNVD
jgi:hypothetical protein